MKVEMVEASMKAVEEEEVPPSTVAYPRVVESLQSKVHLIRKGRKS